VVDSDVACYVCLKGAARSQCQRPGTVVLWRGKRMEGAVLLKLVDGGDIVCFDKWTVVACRTGQLEAAIRDVVVAGAVCRSGELFEELEVREGTRIDGCDTG